MLLRNLPNRPVAFLLRRLVFPIGRTYHAPSDLRGHKLAALVLTPLKAATG